MKNHSIYSYQTVQVPYFVLKYLYPNDLLRKVTYWKNRRWTMKYQGLKIPSFMALYSSFQYNNCVSLLLRIGWNQAIRIKSPIDFNTNILGILHQFIILITFKIVHKHQCKKICNCYFYFTQLWRSKETKVAPYKLIALPLPEVSEKALQNLSALAH